MQLIQAKTNRDIQSARELFKEYEAGLGISLCFQNFEKEVATLPGDYHPPDGRLLLAFEAEAVLGCVALRKLNTETCEMKRLYLRPAARGRGLGRTLVEQILSEARSIGYQRVRLDTLPGKMDQAVALYRSMGFQEIPPYYENPVVGATFMELVL